MAQVISLSRLLSHHGSESHSIVRVYIIMFLIEISESNSPHQDLYVGRSALDCETYNFEQNRYPYVVNSHPSDPTKGRHYCKSDID